MPVKHAYACGSWRRDTIKATIHSMDAVFHPEANPKYRGGDALVWGLIRGSPELIAQIKQSGHDYWHMDNGYFGRNRYFRITKNANQDTNLKWAHPAKFERIQKEHDITLRPWKSGGKHILLALSTPWLYKFMGDDINEWLTSTISTLRKHTDREIRIRPKDTKYPIDIDLKDAFALVTHTSCAALDALQLGVPVFTTGECCAKPVALQDLTKIENPIHPEREPLFWHLAESQWNLDELKEGRWTDDENIHRLRPG